MACLYLSFMILAGIFLTYILRIPQDGVTAPYDMHRIYMENINTASTRHGRHTVKSFSNFLNFVHNRPQNETQKFIYHIE